MGHIERTKYVLNRKYIKRDDTYIGHCPWCNAAIIMHEEVKTHCVCCDQSINWDIENIEV